MTRRLPSATSAAASASVTDNLAARSLPRAPIPTALLGTLGSLSLALITANAWAAPPAKPATVVPARAKTPQQPAPAPRPTLGPGGIHSLPPALLSAPTLPKNYAPTPQATPPGTLPPLPPLPTIPPLPNLNFAQGPARAQAATFSSGDEDGGEEDLAGRVKDLETQLEQTRDLVVGRQPIVTLHGHVDFGFFAAQGDGSGIVRDTGNTIFPEYANQYGWVFLGDLLAPTVNSRGEVADLGDAAGAPRFDSIHSRGAPGFLLNEVNLTANAGLSPQVLGTASVNFIPRTGRDFGLGDFMEVDIAQVEWMPTASGKTSVFVGKFDSLIGIEYRDRKATQRFGITPSLLARYTTGTALGLKVRSKFGTGDWLVLAGAVTNGSNGTEQFHFYNEVDTNAGKTASGRIALHYPGDFELELFILKDLPFLPKAWH